MGIGADRVQVYKREGAAQGGSAADDLEQYAPVPITPQEDAIESAGIYLQDAINRDETTYVARSGNDMVFRDGNNTTPLTLAQLALQGGGGLPPATALGQVLYSEDGSTFTVETPLTSCDGWLVNDDGILLVI